MDDVENELEKEITRRRMASSEERRRVVPQSEIDLQMQLVEPNWSRDNSQQIRLRLAKSIGVNEDNEMQYNNLVDMLDILKRDLRLGNLRGNEVEKCQEGINLAMDCLDHGYNESSILLIGRVAAIIDVSQSRKGFLRKLFGTATIRRENVEMEPKKRGLFGNNKKED